MLVYVRYALTRSVRSICSSIQFRARLADRRYQGSIQSLRGRRHTRERPDMAQTFIGPSVHIEVRQTITRRNRSHRSPRHVARAERIAIVAGHALIAFA